MKSAKSILILFSIFLIFSCQAASMRWRKSNGVKSFKGYISLLPIKVRLSLKPKKDCAGTVDGTAELDNCNVCDADKTNDCVPDCDGVWDGIGAVLWETCYPTNTTYFNLTNSRLTGKIPPDIGNLTNLTELYLWGNQLTGIPPEIGNLTNLIKLHLGGNELTGSIPVEIGNLTNLTYLGLSDNKLSGEIPQQVCDLIESNNLDINHILDGNNLTNTCE